MAFCQMQWFSDVHKKHTTTWVLLPDKLTGPFSTFYLLHGLSDDHTTWMRRTRIETYVADKPIIVVMPDGGRGFYTDHANGPRWAEHIGVELPSFIEQTFPAKPTREGRFIGGLSMGGYGAMRLALGYPERFCSVNSHSGALLCPTDTLDILSISERELIFGSNPAGSAHDLNALARSAKMGGLLPRIRIDCGTEDFLIDQNRALHRSLDQLRIAHEYQEFSGSHTWDYWDLHVREAIAFHLNL